MIFFAYQLKYHAAYDENQKKLTLSLLSIQFPIKPIMTIR
jgi:hypothetical protein